MKKQIKTFLLDFNDFGQISIIAESYSKAESIFLNSKIGGDKVNIKEIKLISQDTLFDYEMFLDEHE